ncbi:MAG: hypothetical protein B7X09_03470 [Acidiphilium sp. 21-66-27]|nr:MAG: hypothetical protein B7X09_03470 [Acidiphilium sp. 21-66-27]
MNGSAPAPLRHTRIGRIGPDARARALAAAGLPPDLAIVLGRLGFGLIPMPRRLPFPWRPMGLQS